MPTQPSTSSNSQDLPMVQRLVSVLWPSFIMAGIATIVFFTVFDPSDLAILLGKPGFSRLGGYTIGFFCFWLLTAISCCLTCYFRRPCKPCKPNGQ